MPRTTRQWAQRKLEESMNNLDWAATHLKHMADVYQPMHPEISEALTTIIDLLAEAHNAVHTIRRSI